MSSPEYIAEAKAYLSSMSEHDLEESGDEFQRLFGYAMELSLALTAAEKRVAYCEANTIALDFRYGDKGQEDTVMVVRLPSDGRYTTSFSKNIDAAMEKANG